MKIELYKSESDAKTINKVLKNKIELEGTFREETSLISPQILIQSDPKLFLYNYMYIPDFDRYYFINNISSYRQNLIIIEARVDVLMSFKDEFLLNAGIVANSETVFNMLLENNEIPVQINQKITDRVFTDVPFFNKITCIMACTNTTQTVEESPAEA